MSQGKLAGSQPTNTGYSPTPNQATIGQFGNAFGAPGAVGTPGGFGSGAVQPPSAPASYVSGLASGFGNQVGPVAPMEDSIANHNDGAGHVDQLQGY
jgi:hypothetical protein